VAKFVKGEVVVLPFPFSDLSQTKRRPAMVLATLQGDFYSIGQLKPDKINQAVDAVVRIIQS
jgi:mRNA interferase MazF